MSPKLFRCSGGEVLWPARGLVLVSRHDGGNLIVNPQQDVWERSELTPLELTQWSFLVAALATAMLNVLPQLQSGCINYWEAGHWSLNRAAEPAGHKTAPEFHRVHMHLLGCSPASSSPSMQWGEAPEFPAVADRHQWAASHERLIAAECVRIVTAAAARLTAFYGMNETGLAPWSVCEVCGYPTVPEPA